MSSLLQPDYVLIWLKIVESNVKPGKQQVLPVRAGLNTPESHYNICREWGSCYFLLAVHSQVGFIKNKLYRLYGRLLLERNHRQEVQV